MHEPEHKHEPEGNSRRLNIGDWLHVIEILVLVFSLGIAWAKFEYTEDIVVHHSQQLDRVEHYLSSRDPEYWKRAHEVEPWQQHP